MGNYKGETTLKIKITYQGLAKLERHKSRSHGEAALRHAKNVTYSIEPPFVQCKPKQEERKSETPMH